MIHVAPALRAPDKIFVEASVCGGSKVRSSPHEPVVPTPKLTAPRIVTPVYIGATFVHFIGLLPSAQLLVEISDGATPGVIKHVYKSTASFKGDATVALIDPIADRERGHGAPAALQRAFRAGADQGHPSANQARLVDLGRRLPASCRLEPRIYRLGYLYERRYDTSGGSPFHLFGEHH